MAFHSQLKTCGIQPNQMSCYANNLNSSRKLMEKSLRIALESLSSHPAMIHKIIITYSRPLDLNLVTTCLLFSDQILLKCLLLSIWARSGIMLRTLFKRRLAFKKLYSHRKSSKSKSLRLQMLANQSSSN